jgi:G:T-mismatch repair DNA endonuclease (very short patch repair protein)
MKQYKCIKIGRYMEDTEKELNTLAKQGWRVICSYAKHGNYLILERDIKGILK